MRFLPQSHRRSCETEKTVVVVGGQEVTTIPEVEYGLELQCGSPLSQGFALNRATKVLPIPRDAEKGPQDS